ncbi:hypothetical protein [Paraburkholderia sp.]|uniref:hypothetical protein n=1 Tax=Paraburkholderia sp. TaxID=1926495 RepID=UPI003D6EEC69
MKLALRWVSLASVVAGVFGVTGKAAFADVKIGVTASATRPAALETGRYRELQ